MSRLASRFGAANLVRRDRPLTDDELMRFVPSVFSQEKHESRSARYTYFPTIKHLKGGSRGRGRCDRSIKAPSKANKNWGLKG